MKTLPCSLVALLLLAASFQAAAQPAIEEPKSPVVKPPLPDEELPLLPPPIKQPPVAEPAPIPRVNDTNKPFDVIVVATAEGAKPAGDRVAIGFFNHSNRDVTLEIDQRTIKLNSRHYVQLKLPREFTWREKDGPMQITKTPENADGVEIVFRR